MSMVMLNNIVNVNVNGLLNNVVNVNGNTKQHCQCQWFAKQHQQTIDIEQGSRKCCYAVTA